MTHNANKRRDHNDAARAAKQQVQGKAGRPVADLRRTPRGARLAHLRKRGQVTAPARHGSDQAATAEGTGKATTADRVPAMKDGAAHATQAGEGTA